MGSERRDPGSPVPERRRADGFRERGDQVTRLEAFVDAAFAFAVTLIVISFDAVPTNMEQLESALYAIPAFAASFALVAMFWYAHHVWSRRYGLDDGRSIFYSLMLVFLVLVWVFPLRVMFTTAFEWIRGIAFGRDFEPTFDVHSLAEITRMFVIYGVAWSSLGLVISALYRQAWRRREALGLDLEERVRTRAEIVHWYWVPVTGVISIAVALLLPPDRPNWSVGVPGMVYFLMFFSGFVQEAAARHARPRIAAELTEGNAPAHD